MSAPLCIGSVLWDLIGISSARMQLGADVPGRIRRLPGGVAMNVAMALRAQGHAPILLSAVGQDTEGEMLIAEAGRLGLQTAMLHRTRDLPTDRYMAIEAPDGLVAAIADAHSLEAAGDAILEPLRDGRLGAPDAPFDGPAVLDGNLSAALLGGIAAGEWLGAADLRLVPASPGKAVRLAPFLGHGGATLYLNLEEAGILLGAPCPDAPSAASALVARGAARVCVTDGPRSAAFADRDGTIEATPPRLQARRVTGAGDTFLAAHLSADLMGAAPAVALTHAIAAAAAHVSGDDE